MNDRIVLKASWELDLLRRSNRLVAETLAALSERVKPGVTTLELDRFAESYLLARWSRGDAWACARRCRKTRGCDIRVFRGDGRTRTGGSGNPEQTGEKDAHDRGDHAYQEAVAAGSLRGRGGRSGFPGALDRSPPDSRAGDAGGGLGQDPPELARGGVTPGRILGQRPADCRIQDRG